jgi:hypothetical protein
MEGAIESGGAPTRYREGVERAFRIRILSFWGIGAQTTFYVRSIDFF